MSFPSHEAKLARGPGTKPRQLEVCLSDATCEWQIGEPLGEGKGRPCGEVERLRRELRLGRGESHGDLQRRGLWGEAADGHGLLQTPGLG